MRDRAHEIAARAEARNTARQRAENKQRQEADTKAEAEGAGEPITLEEEQRLSAAQDAAYRRGRSGR